MVLWLTMVMSPSNMTEKRSSHIAHLSRDFQIAVFILMRLTKPSHFASTPCTTFSAHFVLKRVLQRDTKGVRPFPESCFGMCKMPSQALSSATLHSLPLGCPFPAALVCQGLQRMETCGVHFVVWHRISERGTACGPFIWHLRCAGDNDKWVPCS